MIYKKEWRASLFYRNNRILLFTFSQPNFTVLIYIACSDPLIKGCELPVIDVAAPLAD